MTNSETDWAVARLHVLAEASRIFAEASLDLREALETILQHLAEVIRDSGTIRLLSEDRQWLIPMATYDPDPESRAVIEQLFASSPQRIGEGPSGLVAATGEALLIPVISLDQLRATIPPEYQAFIDRFGIHSALVVPLRVHGAVIGTLVMGRNRTPHRFTHDDQVMLQELADRASFAIENARLHAALQQELDERVQVEQALTRANEELERRVAERTAELRSAYEQLQRELGEREEAEAELREQSALVELLGQVADAANEATTLEQATRSVLEPLCAFMRWPIGHLYQLSDDSPDTLVSSRIWYLSDPIRFAPFRELTERTPLRRGVGLPGQVLASGEPIWISDMASAPGIPRMAAIQAVGVRSAFAVPVLIGTQVAAVLEFFASEPSEPNRKLLETMALIGTQLGRVAERQRAVAALERARAEAERANAAKSEFLSRTSHELRTPLNAILGFAQLLEMDDLNAEQREGVDHILKGGQHLLDLINEVLEIARIEAGRLSLSIEPIQLAELLSEAIELVRPLAAQRRVEIYRGDPSAGERYVLADRQRLKQVLLNLLSNAIKYNRPGGHVTIRCDEANGQVRLAVEDSGLGIPTEHLERLFTPFERLGAERTTVEGTGLGLALSRRLVEAMGGSIGVASVVGQGSTFWITLPPTVPAEHHDSAIAALASSAPAARAQQVLYIEDNLANFTLIERLFARRPGVELLAAMQGRLGLELARQHRPDLVLLDLHLPDIAGEEVLRQLRADQRTHTIPVVIISADATPRQIEHLLASGARAYLTKPLDIRHFLQTLDQVLQA